MKKWSISLLIPFFLFASVSSIFAAETLKVGLLIWSTQQRKTYQKLFEQFEQEHPGVTIKVSARDDAGYKIMLEEWLGSDNNLDVLYWQAGERLFRLVREGLIEPIDDVWEREHWDQSFTLAVKDAVTVTGAMKDAVSYEGQIYGVPISYYQWGFYYKKSLFERLHLQEPKTWEEFLRVCKDVKDSSGIAPFTIGTLNKWSAAGWFDYLNLRINGLTFHQALLRGEIPYTDARVQQVFETWKMLVDNQYFITGHETKDWLQAVPYLYRDKAAMILIGNFIEVKLPQEMVHDIGFFRFPQIDSTVPYYEEAPLEVFMIAKQSEHKDTAKQFLAFMGRADIQTALNKGIGMIAPHVQAEPGESYFLQVGTNVLREAEGISQFYDRDAPKKMADAAIGIFAQFMLDADVEQALQELEKARQGVF